MYALVSRQVNVHSNPDHFLTRKYQEPRKDLPRPLFVLRGMRGGLEETKAALRIWQSELSHADKKTFAALGAQIDPGFFTKLQDRVLSLEELDRLDQFY